MDGTALYEKCDICKQVETPEGNVILSNFHGYAEYGSVHDGDMLTLHICQHCLDRLIAERNGQQNKKVSKLR